MALENLDDLEASWAIFMEEKNSKGRQTQDAKWRVDNPGEWSKLKAYKEGTGARPTLDTSTGRRMVEMVDAYHEAKEVVVEPPPVDPPPPQTGEPTLVRPYASSSIFNSPIGLNPNVHQDSAAIVASAASLNPFGPTLNSTPSLYEANSTTQLTEVIVNHPTCDNHRVSVKMDPSWRGGNGGFASPADGEPCMVVRDPNGDEWSFFKITPPNQVPLVSSGGPASCPTRSQFACTRAEKGSWRGSGTGPTYRGSGTLAGTGLIMAAETQSTPVGGDWGHALAMAYPRTRRGSWVAPANTSDGQYTDASSVPMGARFWLPPAFNIESANLREWQKQMCRTIRKYGIVVIDSGSAIVCEGLASVRARKQRFKWEDDGGWLTLPPSVVAQFKVVVP